MSDRLSCCVPFCRRTRHNREGYSAWICGEHWRSVPKRLRARKSKYERMYRRRYGQNAYWTFKAGSPDRLGAIKLDRICKLAWAACQRAAIERAVGI